MGWLKRSAEAIHAPVVSYAFWVCAFGTTLALFESSAPDERRSMSSAFTN
jgi:hypothetical protein